MQTRPSTTYFPLISLFIFYFFSTRIICSLPHHQIFHLAGSLPVSNILDWAINTQMTDRFNELYLSISACWLLEFAKWKFRCSAGRVMGGCSVFSWCGTCSLLRSIRMTFYFCFLVALSLCTIFPTTSKSDLCYRKSDFCPFLFLNCVLCLYAFFSFLT